MAVKLGDTVPAECTPVAKLVVRPLKKDGDGNLAKETLTSGRQFIRRKLLLSSRKDQYITDFAASGISVCNSNFAEAKKLIRIHVSSADYGFVCDTRLTASVANGLSSGSLNGISIGTLNGFVEGPNKLVSFRTDSTIPGIYEVTTNVSLSLVTIDATNTLTLSVSPPDAGATSISGEIRKAVKVDGDWYGNNADQLFLIETGGGVDPPHEFSYVDDGSGNNSPTFTGPNVTDARLDYLDPKGGPVYAAGGDVTIKGTGFVNGVNIASLDGTPVVTTFVDADTLTATIPASYLGAGKLTVSGRVGWFYLYN